MRLILIINIYFSLTQSSNNFQKLYDIIFLNLGQVGGIFMFNQTSEKVKFIPVVQIEANRAQPRTVFLEDKILSLSESIKENGILQPLTVRKILASRYELIAGERRLRAAIKAGLKMVPCIVLSCDDEQSAVFALLENLQRADLGPFEEAEGIYKLITNFNLTQEMAAKKLGKKQSTIANKLRLLKLSLEEREKITEAGLTERHARSLLRLQDPLQRDIALNKIIINGLNVQKTELLIESMLNKTLKKAGKSQRTVIIKDLRIFMNTINKAIDTMKLSGIDAKRSQRETDDYIEYVVVIPKSVKVKTKNTA